MTACPLGQAGQCYCAKQVNSFATAGPSQKTAVLLLAHGSPENPSQVPEFLSYVTVGRPLPPTVVEEVRHRYSLIGFSPLPCWTLLQADQLAQSSQMPVFVGMRNWKPFIAGAVKAIASNRYERVIAICLAPQNSRTSVGLYRSAVVGDGNLPFKMDFVEEWHDQPLLAKAFAEKLRSGWEKACAESGAKLPVIFTAHSVPERTITEGDPYERQAKETAQLVAKEAGLGGDDWTFAFQSQGMSGGVWIGPTVEDTIRNLKAKGHRGVFLDPIGFLCDHVEVLYDIDIAFKQFAEKEGIRLWRAESLNGSKLLTEAVTEVVRNRK
ncbi:MAG: ferrochelatase [Acidobacteriia bacterium]|nr:ferrochelatase [Terriglobia bacterium]